MREEYIGERRSEEVSHPLLLAASLAVHHGFFSHGIETGRRYYRFVIFRLNRCQPPPDQPFFRLDETRGWNNLVSRGESTRKDDEEAAALWSRGRECRRREYIWHRENAISIRPGPVYSLLIGMRHSVSNSVSRNLRPRCTHTCVPLPPLASVQKESVNLINRGRDRGGRVRFVCDRLSFRSTHARHIRHGYTVNHRTRGDMKFFPPPSPFPWVRSYAREVMEQDVNNIFEGRCYSTGFFPRAKSHARARVFSPCFFIVSPWKIFNPHFGNGFDGEMR